MGELENERGASVRLDSKETAIHGLLNTKGDKQEFQETKGIEDQHGQPTQPIAEERTPRQHRHSIMASTSFCLIC